MVINKKIKRTILENKSLYLGSISLIIMSCLLFSLLNLLSVNLVSLIASFEKNYNQEDATFMVNKPLGNISALEETFNLELEESLSFDTAVSEEKLLRVFSENTKVNIPAIIEGKALRGNDILIDPAYAKANQLKIGDRIDINHQTFTISGFMSLPNYIYPLKKEGDLLTDPNRFGVAVITKEDFHAISQGNRSYSVKFNALEDNLESQISEFRNYLTSENIVLQSWMNRTNNPRITFVTAKLKGIDQVSATLPIAILLLTCILTGTVMWRMIQRESLIIGTLYALGYKKKQIQNHYLRYPLFIALTGGIIGTILGGLTLRPMINVMVSYFNMPVDSLNFSLKIVLISILLPVIFLMGAGYVVIRKALQKSPLYLMRGGNENNKIGFLERKIKLDHLKFSTKFKIREQLRSLPRSAFLFLGVSLATMLLLLGFTAKSSLDRLMQEGFEEAFRYNYSYVFNSLQQGSPAQGEAFSELPLTSPSDNTMSITAYGVSPYSQYVQLKDKAGSGLSIQKVLITRPLADKLKLNPQDTLHVINKLDMKEYSITIDGIAESSVGNNIYLPLSEFNRIFNYPTGSYMGLWSTEKLSLPENTLLTTVTKDEIKSAFDAMTAPIQTTVGAMAFLSFIIGLIVIYVVTSMIIEENKENISLMKVFGYRKKEVYSLILNSSTFLVILGYVVGVPLLLTSMNALFKSITEEMTISLPITISPSYLLIGFAIIYMTYEISKALSKKKVNRISMSEVLKSGLE